MAERFGVILLDQTELILRVYQIYGATWRLAYYANRNIAAEPYHDDLTTGLTVAIAEIFSDHNTEHIAEWRVCVRSVPNQISNEIHTLTGFSVEYLTPQREQELLCKGMFTELW